MISDEIIWELTTFAVSLWNGFLLAWYYDFIRLFRRIVRHKHILFMAIEDILFGEYLGVAIFVLCLRVDKGIIRGFVLGALMLGAFVYFRVASRQFLKYATKAIKVLFKPIRMLARGAVRFIGRFRKEKVRDYEARNKKAEGRKT